MPLLQTTLCLLLVAAFAQTTFVQTAFAQTGAITFDVTDVTFAEVEEGAPAQHVFTFRNTGDAPLRLTAVRPSCGCTSPEWSRDPVAPGDSGSVTVVYDSKGRPGAFHKSILVKTDGEPASVTLHIRGQVRPTTTSEALRPADG